MSSYDPFDEDSENETEKSLSSYSDLFAAISFCFLFLYVVNSLQSNVSTIHNQYKLAAKEKENQEKMSELIAKYEKMLKTYEIDKDAYLQNANQDEVAHYNQALDKLKLLAENNKKNKEELLKQAQDFASKEKELNDYQKVIKNIVESNLALKHRVVKKEKDLIEDKKSFEMQVTQKMDQDLKKNVQDIQSKYHAELQRQIEFKESEIKAQYAEKKEKDLKLMYAEIARSNKQKEKELQSLQKYHSENLAKLQADNQLTKKQQAEILEKNKAEINQLVSKYSSELNTIKSSYEKKEQNLTAAMEAENSRKAAELARQFEQEKTNLQSKLTDANSKIKEMAERRDFIKGVAKSLKKNFEDAGIKAQVNEETGEVTLAFSKVYFDKGQFKLKNEMQDDLSKFLPTYAKAVLLDQKILNRIDSFEVIGFASPTFNKKYINPKELKVSNLNAVSFNLDLSYKRARSIYEFVFNPKKISFDGQDTMFKMTKVSGRSFLDGKEVKEDDRVPANVNDKDYCEKYNCHEQQKVIIKFVLKP
jgi:outer membrane protein OmpA-like peptidoglycan-associated protein